MGRYIQVDTELPTYFQFPAFLINVPVSQTAKLVYMVLYDRTRLSQKNTWFDENGVYVRFPI